MNKLKSIDWKQFGIDHVEKIVFGLFALIVLMGLFGTRWAGYDRAPQELKQLSDDADRKILASTWPEEKRKEFEGGSNIAERVVTLVTGLDPAQWQYGNEGPSWPLIKRHQPVREPEWLAVRQLVATPGRFILSERVEEEFYDPYNDPDQLALTDQPEEDYDPRFAPRNSLGGATAPGFPASGPDAGRGLGGPMAGRGAPGPMAGGPMAGGPMAGGRGAMGPMAGRGAGPDRGGRGGRGGRAGKGSTPNDVDPAAMMGPAAGGGLYGMGGMGATAKGRGERFIAVRGVFPIMDQREKIADATNQTNAPQLELLELLDFTLERQTAVGGEEKWGPWEPMKIERAKDVLSEASDFDPDVVDAAIIDNVITMPLPARGAGWWTEDIASHPQVRNYQLSPEEMEMELEINRKLIEQYQEMEDQGGRRFTAKPGGFADSMLDIRGIRNDVMFSQFGGNFLQSLDEIENMDEREKALMESIKKRVGAQGRVLLFRYFDFEVAPENVYRYRVKLTMRNPNLMRQITEVIDPSVIEGETRETPWSDPSNPAYVKKDAQYFIDNVQVAGRTNDGVSFDIFQWYPKTGTHINNVLKVKFGQIIGGESTAKVLKPLEMTFEDEDVTFDSGDVLVDAREEIVLDREEHADLQLPPRERGHFGSVDRALIMNRYGELAMIDEASDDKEHKQAKDLLAAEQGPYEVIKDAIRQAEQYDEQEGLDALIGAGGPMAGGPMAGGPAGRGGRGGRGKNPLRMPGGDAGTDPNTMMPGRGAPGGGRGGRGGGRGGR